ncbi:unnamed protein product [Didymodactylos carnosus]|uniref:Uncharacterized protein n=1 Tax=Didymodactylos carnosus TaxID=1234261 RepID=A0A814PCU0_9BILA|nr:unnamed protein product [Didymodactylos carnosus]CAF1103551.1 unnamed protein product [Didymodactylos carnosus]CAF3717627.1 unnamed protein product [Didymodactylos carnosus]CAF3868335.1 unnamed protein product [Didymodactylos carnosus]
MATDQSKSDHIYPTYQHSPGYGTQPPPPYYSQTTGMYPGQTTGMYPGQTTGMYPGQTTGMYPGPPMGHTPIIMAPVYQRPIPTAILSPITPSLKLFFILSGILYILLGVLGFGLEIGLITKGYSSNYRGFWAGGFIIGCGISMLIAACKPYYAMIRLVVSFIIAVFFIVAAIILSIVNLELGDYCYLSWYYHCDPKTGRLIKIVILVVFIVSLIQTIVNLVVVSTVQKRNRRSAQTTSP